MSFGGFPSAALTFYADLEADNTRESWQAHTDVYEDAVHEPMELPLDELPAEFGGKTTPRGFPKDHPRIELLRRKRHMASQSLAGWPWPHTSEAKDRIAQS